jgi:maltooligosyltrehalose trehalohydrolase
VLLGPAIPLLFMGEEWAASTPFRFFSDFGPEFGRLVTDGRRDEFAVWPAFRDPAARERIPDPQDPRTMRESTLRWEERGAEEHAAAQRLHGELLGLRHRVIEPRLASGAFGDGGEPLAATAIRVRWRFGDGTRLSLIANLGAQPATVSYADLGLRIFALGEVPSRADGTTLPAWSVGWFLAT